MLFEALVPGERTSAARALLVGREPALAPDLIAIEIAAALTRAVRRRLMEPDFARQAQQAALTLLPRVRTTSSVLARAVDMSLDLAHPLADCVFLAHAEARTARLVTSDVRFVRKLDATPFATLVIELPA